ncbi:MAG TPA: histidine kinase [Pseudonocardia sp.]|uniref:histidine kinase n=1 Tax=Pseudonocardia sp. TaxID=60912 RepID=UPI002ED9D8D1
MTPASPRQDGERSPNGLPVGGPQMLPVAGPVTRLREAPGEDPDENTGDAQRRRESDQWLRRRLLERQLHDGASLRISALALRLGLLRDQAPFDEADWENRIGQLQDELHAVLQELREVAGKIYPPLLDQAGLGPAIREEADRLGAELEIEVAPELPRRRFGPVAEGAAYFAVAECLAARPDEALPALRVSISRDENDLVMVVSGVGARHLRLMLDQARPLGGTADLAEGGTPETGTITMRIPCE